MAKQTTLSVAARNVGIDAMMNLLNNGTIEVRTGAPPASPETAATGTLLLTFTLPADAFTAATSASGALGTVAPATAVAAGDAGYARFKQSGGTAVMDVVAGEAADTPNLTISEKTMVIGDSVTITGYNFTMPASSSL